MAKNYTHKSIANNFDDSDDDDDDDIPQSLINGDGEENEQSEDSAIVAEQAVAVGSSTRAVSYVLLLVRVVMINPL